MRRVAVVAAFLAPAIVVVLAASAAPGSLDRRFGGDGIVTAFTGGGVATAVGIDHEGRIVVAGSTTDGGVDVAVARLRPNGTFDPSFGHGGRIRVDLGGADDAFGLAIGPGDGIAIAGRTSSTAGARMFVLRLNASGAPVPTFGTDGVGFVGFGWSLQSANAVAFARKGRLVLGGYTSNGSAIRCAVARLLPDGTLDPAFGGDGRVTLNLSAAGEQVNDLLVLPGGRIVAAGSADVGLQPQVALFRLNPDGSLDTGFGTSGGVTQTDLGPGPDAGNALAMTADRHLVVAGLAGNGGRSDWGVARYGAGGHLDPAFGAAGIVVVPFTAAFDEALALVPTGPRLVVVGRIHTAASGDDAGVIMLSANGHLDPTFGAGGVVRIDLAGSTDVARAAALQPNGRIVIAGEGRRGGVPRFLIVRLLRT
jgi:uncharacterized delta-60 repeat protein